MSYLNAINTAMDGTTGVGGTGGCGGLSYTGMAPPSAQSVQAFNNILNGGEGSGMGTSGLPGGTTPDVSQCSGKGASDAADNGNGNQAALSGDTLQQLLQLVQSMIQQLQNTDSGAASDSDMASSYQNGGNTNGMNGLTSGDCDQCH